MLENECKNEDEIPRLLGNPITRFCISLMTHQYKEGNGKFNSMGDLISRISQRRDIIQICEEEGLRKLFLRSRMVGEGVEVSYRTVKPDGVHFNSWTDWYQGLEINIKSQPSNPNVNRLAEKIRGYCNQTWIDEGYEEVIDFINKDVQL